MNLRLNRRLSAAVRWGRRLTAALVLGFFCAPLGQAHEITLEWNRWFREPGQNPAYKRILKVDEDIYIGGVSDRLLFGKLNRQRDGFEWQRTFRDSLNSTSLNQMHWVDDRFLLISTHQSEDQQHNEREHLVFHYLNIEGDSVDGFDSEIREGGNPWVQASFFGPDSAMNLFINSGYYIPFGYRRIDANRNVVFDHIYDGTEFGTEGFDRGDLYGVSSVIQLSNGDFLLTGTFEVEDDHRNDALQGEGDCMVRMDTNGESVWVETNIDTFWFRERPLYTHSGSMSAALEHSSGFIYATGRKDIFAEPNWVVTLYKYDQDGNKIWQRYYNDNFDVLNTKFDHIIELRPDVLALFGKLAFRREDEREPGLCVILVDSSGEWLTEYFVRGEWIRVAGEGWRDVVKVDSNRVMAITEMYGRVVSIRFDLDPVNAVEDGGQAVHPNAFTLSAFPNPFNSSTTITFATDGTPPPTPPASGGGAPTRLAVYDLSGREVVDLIGSTGVSAGQGFHPATEGGATEHKVVWDAADHGGSAVETHKIVWDAAEQPAGVYLVRLEVGNRSVTRKVVLMR